MNFAQLRGIESFHVFLVCVGISTKNKFYLRLVVPSGVKNSRKYAGREGSNEDKERWYRTLNAGVCNATTHCRWREGRQLGILSHVDVMAPTGDAN